MSEYEEAKAEAKEHYCVDYYADNCDECKRTEALIRAADKEIARMDRENNDLGSYIMSNSYILNNICAVCSYIEQETCFNQKTALAQEIARVSLDTMAEGILDVIVTPKDAAVPDDPVARRDERAARIIKDYQAKDAELARLREDKPNMCGRHKHRVALFCEECIREALKEATE